MNNLLIALAVFVITVVGALFAVPYFIDWNGYRGVFEEEATRLLGREVRVGGQVNLHLLPTPFFRFEKVRIAETTVDLEEPFFRAESVAIKLSVPPFFRGVVEANEIEFQQPILRLALDQKGGWNWQSFGQVLGASAYMPANIALTSLKIVDGVLAVHGPDGAERTRFDRLNGELSAPALEGPYRFRGVFGKQGAERELRISTARPEPDGMVRFRTSVRFADTGSIYMLDARLVDFMGSPRAEGELTARLPIAGLGQQRTAAPRSAAQATAEHDPVPDPNEAAFDLKAAVKVDASGAVLSDLSLTFEQDGRPQLITGDLKADWRSALALQISLVSRWLDLDRIAGASDSGGPLASVLPFAGRFRDLLPGDGRSQATISVEQANLGKDVVSGLRMTLIRTTDRLEVSELRAGMPGGSRGELTGVVTGPATAPAFEGSVGVRGSSVTRFVTWATGNAFGIDVKADGAFGVRSKLAISAGRAAASNIVADLSGTALNGAAQYRWEGRPAVSLLLEGAHLDTRPLAPAGFRLAEVFDLLIHGPAARPAGNAPAPRTGWRGSQIDASIRVNAGQMLVGTRSYRDVAAEIEIKDGNLKLPLLRLSSDEAFSLELEGEVADAAAKPKGSLRGLISVETAAGFAPLAELLGIPDAFRPGLPRAQPLVPARLAGSLAFGGQSSADLTLDGEVNGANLKASVRIDSGAGGWRDSATELTATLESPDGAKLVDLFAPGRSERTGPGRVLIKATGVPSAGLASLVNVEAGDLSLAFRGKFVAAEGGNGISGDLDIKAADGTRVAALAGLAPPLRLDGLPLAGTLKVAASSGSIGIDRLALKIGGADVRGQISLAPAGERRRIEARLDVDEITLAKVFAPLLDQRLAIVGAAETAISGRQSLWPDEAFDPAVLDGFEGNIRLTSRRLALADGIGLKEASFDIAFEAGKVEVKELTGTGLGGRVSAAVRIAKAPNGVEVSGALRLAGGSLEAISGAKSQRASGAVNGEIAFSGRGTSPRAALAALQGSGKVELGEARIGVLWPGAVTMAVDAALKADSDRLVDTLKRALIAGLESGTLPLGTRTVAIEIVDGQLRAKPIVIETAEGRASGGAAVDLGAFNFEAEWRLEQKPTGGPKAPLPAVVVTYSGPAAALSRLEPRVNLDALEREVAVRRVERDVEELERIRKLDEERRRSEADRLRRQFEPPPPQSPPAAAPAPPPPGARPAAPG